MSSEALTSTVEQIQSNGIKSIASLPHLSSGYAPSEMTIVTCPSGRHKMMVPKIELEEQNQFTERAGPTDYIYLHD